MKNTEYWYKNRNIDQWTSIEDPDISSHTYGHLNFDKEERNTQWIKNKNSSTNGAGSI